MTVRRRAVAELAVAVVAPALDAARRGDGAGVGAAGGDRRDAGRQAGDIDGRRAVCGGVVAELAVEVPAPTLDAAARREGAGVIGAGSGGLAPEVRPETSTGIVLSKVVPSPS
jgi:hypothetical protein